MSLKTLDSSFFLICLFFLMICAGFSAILHFNLGHSVQAFSTFAKSFLSVFVLTTKNTLFDIEPNLDNFELFLMVLIYVVLIAQMSALILTFFVELVRNIFIKSKTQILTD